MELMVLDAELEMGVSVSQELLQEVVYHNYQL
jgi:hypothetical protein